MDDQAACQSFDIGPLEAAMTTQRHNMSQFALSGPPADGLG
jgi:hypothetical protein